MEEQCSLFVFGTCRSATLHWFPKEICASFKNTVQLSLCVASFTLLVFLVSILIPKNIVHSRCIFTLLDQPSCKIHCLKHTISLQFSPYSSKPPICSFLCTQYRFLNWHNVTRRPLLLICYQGVAMQGRQKPTTQRVEGGRQAIVFRHAEVDRRGVVMNHLQN